MLTDGTLVNETRLAERVPLAERRVAFQIPLDSPEPDVNDEMRDHCAKVSDAFCA